jgi:hypothetical protein
MPIETAIEQEAIADSLLGPPTHVVGTNPETGNASLITLENAGLEAQELPEVDEEEAAPAYLDRQEWQGAEREEDSAADERDELPEELQELQYEVRDELARQLAQEQGQKDVTQNEVTQNPSAAQQPTANAALEQIDTIIEASGLNAPERTAECASSFCSALGLREDQTAMDAQGFSNTMDRVTVSAASVANAVMSGRLQSVPPVSVEAGQALAKDFLGSFGVDSRLLPARNAQQLGQLFFDSDVNIIATGEHLGWPEDASAVNDLGMAMHFAQRLMTAFGGNPKSVDPAAALRLADWRYGMVRSTLMATAQRPAGGARQAGSGRTVGHRVASGTGLSSSSGTGRGRSRFQTNQDLFDHEAEEIYKTEHGRL